MNTQAAEAIRKRVAIEFREHNERHGRDPGQWQRWVNQILEPIVPWQQVLQSTVRGGIGFTHGQTDYTYTKISRRQAAARNVVLPALRRPIPNVAIIIDTSGSMDDGLLAQALGEIDGILAALAIPDAAVTTMAVDAAVHSLARVRSAAELPLAGGGGTAMTVGIDTALRLRPRPQLIVVVTDGFTDWPTIATPMPVIAAILGRDRNKLPPTPDWIQRVDVVP